MLITALGPFSWLIQTTNSNVLVNPRLETAIHGCRLTGEMLKYRGVSKALKLELPKLTAVIQLSEQYQYFDPTFYQSKDVVITFVTPTSILANKNFIPCHIMELNHWHKIEDFEFCFTGSQYGNDFWDNTGASLSLRELATGQTIFIQGNNSLHTKDMLPTSYDLVVLTWNAFSTKSPISAYANLFDDEEYFDLSYDAAKLLEYCSQAPISQNLALQGNDFLTEDNHLCRRSLTFYSSLLDRYMLGCKVQNIEPGDSFNLSTNTIKKNALSSSSLNHSKHRPQKTKTLIEEELLNDFLRNYANIILLTKFGQEMFGVSNIGDVKLGASRYCFIIDHDTIQNPNLLALEFDLTRMEFKQLTEEYTLEQLTMRYPYGVSINAKALERLLKGEETIWAVTNSKLFKQWYLGSPKNAPVSSLHLFFQECCESELTIKFWKSMQEDAGL